MFRGNSRGDEVLGHLGCFCREIVDNHEKENALNIVTEERTYHIYAESPEDARFGTFSTVIIPCLLCQHFCGKPTSGGKVPPCGCQWYFSKFCI